MAGSLPHHQSSCHPIHPLALRDAEIRRRSTHVLRDPVRLPAISPARIGVRLVMLDRRRQYREQPGTQLTQQLMQDRIADFNAVVPWGQRPRVCFARGGPAHEFKVHLTQVQSAAEATACGDADRAFGALVGVVSSRSMCAGGIGTYVGYCDELVLVRLHLHERCEDTFTVVFAGERGWPVVPQLGSEAIPDVGCIGGSHVVGSP